ncbi:MAG: threonine/serine exporter family protein [Oscillospiraceae bacterium]|nr:threonine/serine exporter family protein [Oscillospiraceae bacterium]
MIKEIIAAALGTVAFILLSGAPRKYYLHCAIVGAAGWALYSVLMAYVMQSAVAATFFATVLVILISRFLAVYERCPVTVFLIAGIIPLVPGAGIYWTAYHLVTGSLDLALESGLGAMKSAIAIVFGIVLVFELPQKCFRFPCKNRKEDPPK